MTENDILKFVQNSAFVAQAIFACAPQHWHGAQLAETAMREKRVTLVTELSMAEPILGGVKLH